MEWEKSFSALTEKQLVELAAIYARNWLAMDGLWFQAVERRFGMDAAMACDVEIWEAFTVIEARRIRTFLSLPDRPGLEGLARALPLRLYARINPADIRIEGDCLWYRMTDCRVQQARKRKGLPYHPCKAVGLVEYGAFARCIDPRISCECVSCYPDVTDPGAACVWKFTLCEDEAERSVP